MPLPEVPPAPEAPPTPRAVRVEPTPPPELAPIFASPPPPPQGIPDASGDGGHAGTPAAVFAAKDGDPVILGALDRRAAASSSPVIASSSRRADPGLPQQDRHIEGGTSV